MILCGPITLSPAIEGAVPGITVEIIGAFSTPQELEELLAKRTEVRSSNPTTKD